MTYVLMIKRQGLFDDSEIEKYIKTVFKSYDYMKGFFDGYTFNTDYSIKTLEEFEKVLKIRDTREYYIKFLTVDSLED